MDEETAPVGSDKSDTEAARQHFERALRLVRYARVGVSPEDRRSAFVAAVTEFEKVLEIAPSYPRAHTNLGFCLVELGRHGDAKREIELALQQCPEDVSALINYAVILNHNEAYDEAERCLRRAMELDPRRGNTSRELAYLLERRRKFRAAADQLERYLELTPHANDERAVRRRIKLLRNRTSWLELPEYVVTPVGFMGDLRRRGLALLLDGPVLAALWYVASFLSRHVTSIELSVMPIFISLVYVYYLLGHEAWGGSMGKILLNLRVRAGQEASWYSPLAVRETLKLAPILLGLLGPFPWDLLVMVCFLIIDGWSALQHPQGQSWYDRLTRVWVVEWNYRKVRILAGMISFGCLLGAIVSWAA